MLLQMPTGGMDIANILMIVGMVAVFYFFLLRPQQQQRKKQKAFLESLTREM